MNNEQAIEQAIETVIDLSKMHSPVQKYAGVRFTGKTAAKLSTYAIDSYQMSNETLYTFKHDLDLHVGDVVVCDCTTGLAVGYVAQLHELPNVSAVSRWLVQKVDMETHKLRMARDAKKKEIRRLMDDRRKQLEDEALYRMMAERDPEMAKLIEQYYGV